MEAKMIGILMAAVILASVFVAIVPTVSARPAPDKIDSGDTVYIGEQGLDFNLDGDTDYNDSDTIEGVPDTPTEGASPITVSPNMTIDDSYP